MSISQEQLGQRLKVAREASSLTQARIADHLDLPRTAIAQIESGKRSVSSLELGRLADLYDRDIRDFLSEDFQEEGPFVVLFRADEELDQQQEMIDSLRQCIQMGSELTNLERLAGLDREIPSVVRYNFPVPKSRYDAIRCGVSAAKQERQRIGIDSAPIGDIAEHLEKQGIRTAVVDLPDDISGLTLFVQNVGSFVAVNSKEHVVRRIFSFAHEYAHVVMGQDSHCMISRGSERTGLLEVLANAFAASFLMPESGVREPLINCSKLNKSSFLPL